MCAEKYLFKRVMYGIKYIEKLSHAYVSDIIE